MADERSELETLRARKRLLELESKASGMSYGDVTPASMPIPQLENPKPPQDENVDYENDLGDMKFRAAYSFMRGKRQQEAFLNRSLGEGNWGYDSGGNTIIKPAGLAKFGIKSDKARPLDKASPSTADLADYASIIPPTLGGIGGSLAATGVGTLPGLALAGLGAGAGQLLAEGGKAIAGVPPTAGEALESIGSEALGGATGEATFRALRGVGKMALQPGKQFMTPEREALMQDALKRGFVPYPGQVTGSRIQQRIEGVSRKMFGTANEMVNIPKTIESLENLKKWAGPGVSQEEIGNMVKADLAGARKTFGDTFNKLYAEVDLPVPTASLVQQAKDILASKVRTRTGEAITLDPPTEKFLTSLTQLPESMSAQQMHSLRTSLRNRAQVKNLAPTMDLHEYGLLRDAADRTFEDSIKLNASQAYAGAKVARMREIDDAYRQGIQKFDLPFLGNIAKKPSMSSAVDADQVLEYALEPKHTVRARQLMENLTEPTRQAVRRGLADDLTAKMFIDSPDPFSKIVSGTNFKEALDKYSPETLKTVMGDEWTKEAYKLADVVKLVTSGNNQSGGLVVANAILNPVQHMGALAGYKLLSKAMTNKTFLKYMTTGVANPTSKAGKAALSAIENTMRILAQTSTSVEEGSIPTIEESQQ